MSNVLTKKHGLQQNGYEPFWVPGDPPVPPYCVDVVTTSQSQSGTYVSDPGDPLTGRPPGVVWVPGPTTTTSTTTHTCYPGQAGTPGHFTTVPSFSIDYQQGWNGAAISIGQIDVDGVFEFSVPQGAVGVVAGLDNSSAGSSYIEIQYAIYCASGIYSIMESGVLVPGMTGSYVDADVFAIVRQGGQVNYFKNTTLIYTSLVPSVGALIADCSVYMAGDQINNASLSTTIPTPLAGSSSGMPPPAGGTPPPNPYGDTAGAANTLRGMVGFFTDQTGAYMQHDRLRGMVGNFQSYNTGALTGVMPGMVGAFVTPDACGMAGVMGGMVAHFEANLIQPQFAVTNMVLGSMSGFAYSYAGMTGVLAGVLGGMRGYAANAPNTITGSNSLGSALPNMRAFFTNTTAAEIQPGTPPAPGSIDPTTGDWIGRSGPQLRSMVGRFLDPIAAAGTTGALAGQMQGLVGFLTNTTGAQVQPGLPPAGPVNPATGDWPGRSGAQLRSMVASMTVPLPGPTVVADMPHDGAPIPPIVYTGGGSTTLFEDTFSSGSDLSTHSPDIGGSYVTDNGNPLSHDTISGGSLNATNTSVTSTATALAPLSTPVTTGANWTISETITATTGAGNLDLYISSIQQSNDNYSVDADLIWNGTTWTLNTDIYDAAGSLLYSNSVNVTAFITSGVPFTLTIQQTATGTYWAINGGVVDSTSIKTNAVFDAVAFNYTSNTGSSATVDVISVTQDSSGASIQTGGVDPFTGDWAGRGGDQLRSMVARMWDDVFIQHWLMGGHITLPKMRSAGVIDTPLIPGGGMPSGAALVLPSPLSISGNTGASADLTLPMFTLEISGTFDNTARGDLTLPLLSVDASGTLGTVLGGNLDLPSPLVVTTVAQAANAALVLPSLFTTVRAVTDLHAGGALTLPRLGLAGSVSLTYGVAQGTVILPALLMASNALAGLFLPPLRASGHIAQGVSQQTRLGYAMNLATGAVTEFSNFPFKAMGRAYNLYWGVGLDGNLYQMGGDLDDTTPIDWEWQSGLADFGVWGQKGVLAVYIEGEFQNGATLTFVSDDATRVYGHKAAGLYNTHKPHRIPTGRGVRTHNMAFGMADTTGGYLELDKVTPEYIIIPRNL